MQTIEDISGNDNTELLAAIINVFMEKHSVETVTFTQQDFLDLTRGHVLEVHDDHVVITRGSPSFLNAH